MYNHTCVVCLKPFEHSQKLTKSCSKECRTKRLLDISGRQSWNKEISPGTVGAMSEMMVAIHLMRLGYAVFRALSPSCFCDLMAVKDGRMLRIEARTGYTTPLGKIAFPRNTNGTIDYFGVYAPSNNGVTFFDAGFSQVEMS